MAQWQCIASKIKLQPHPNADRMLIAQVNLFQLVVGKDNGYQDGDIVIFAPERAILPESLRPFYTNTETGQSYLAGPNHDRVKQVRLRGELSEGVTIPVSWVLENNKVGWESVQDIPLDTDISLELGITKYEPAIPINMTGVIKPLANLDFSAHIAHHDVEQFRLFSDEFQQEEMVYVMEKLHGTQINIMTSRDNQVAISSKGYLKRDLIIEEDPTNLYWMAAQNCNLITFGQIQFPGHDVQIIGEIVPCQKNYNYGLTKPQVRIFRFICDGEEWSYNRVVTTPKTAYLGAFWVPKIWHGVFKECPFEKLAQGKETLSGHEMHIKEGIVVSPEIPRRSRKGFPLFLKILNSKFKSDDEDFS
jgi:RNA ligase (TIGR02306 family)